MDTTHGAAGSASPHNRGKKGMPWAMAARNAMFLLASVVFAGWVMSWAVRPTRTYNSSWGPKLAADTNTTYFGGQGTSILISMFPMLFVFVVACGYLDLLKKECNANRGGCSSKMAAWRRPVLVRGPQGIVTGIELAFFLMFMVLLVWCYSVSVDFSNIRTKPSEKLWQAKLEITGKLLGFVGNVCCAFLFFPVARGSSLLPLFGLTSEASIKYHAWLGHISMVLFTAHGLSYIIFWLSTNQIHKMGKWARTGFSNVAGELALLSGLAMWVTTVSPIRRRMFELFFYTHHLYILFFVFYALHIGITFFCYILPGIFLFMVDRCLRFLQSRSHVCLVSARVLPSEAVELNFSKTPGLRYNPMSTIFINVPRVSRLEWHPFTVTSSSGLEPERLSVVVKNEGRWTEKLYTTLSSQPVSDGRLDVSVEGPYSPASSRFLGYDFLVMVSGGNGITPFISIIRDLIYMSGTAVAATPSLLLISTFKTSADMAMLDLLVPISGALFSGVSRLKLRVEAFVTRESEAPSGDNWPKPIQEIWFKPSPSDVPIASVLGSNSWLWLGAVVSSSFVIFLVLTGVLQHVYIHPTDSNSSGAMYPSAARTMLNLAFLCISIVVSASAAFLLNKRESAKEKRQIQNVLPLPRPWLGETGGAARELESFPQQPLVQATKVQFGRRPNLKRMLLEIKGDDVGVIASGPSGLLEDVAAICSSGLANNLHFESISFSW